MPNKVTISLIKCDVGSLAGHYIVPKPLFSVAEKSLKKAVEKGVINNFYVFNAGDDLELLMVHEKGEQNQEIHKLAWDTFKECANKASKLNRSPQKLFSCNSLFVFFLQMLVDGF